MRLQHNSASADRCDLNWPAWLHAAKPAEEHGKDAMPEQSQKTGGSKRERKRKKQDDWINSYILQARQASWAEMLQSGDKQDGN